MSALTFIIVIAATSLILGVAVPAHYRNVRRNNEADRLWVAERRSWYKEMAGG